MDKQKIVLANRLFVPASLVEDSYLQKFHYTWNQVEYRLEEDEYGDVVKDSRDEPVRIREVKEVTFQTFKETFPIGGGHYYAFPRGNLEKVSGYLRGDYSDRRPLNPLGVPLKLRKHVVKDHRWPDQKRCVVEYLKLGYGILKGDTGSGKTIMGIAAMCRIGMTTIILSKRKDGNRQWIEEIQKHTNIEELEEQTGQTLIGEYKGTRKNKKLYPITLATVQSFLGYAGRDFLKEYQNEFGMVMIDEVHEFGTPKYSKVVHLLNPFAVLGLTATVDREDQMHHLVFDMVGPVVAEGTAKQMPPTVHFIGTGEEAPTWIYEKNFPNYYQWNVILKQLSSSDERYGIIMKYIWKDLAAGKIMVCISERRKFVKTVYKKLVEADIDVAYVDGTVKDKQRQKIYKAFNNGEYQIICAGKVLNALVNLPTVNCLHFLSPSSSQNTTKQIYGRARRWLAGKENPIIRDYVDTGGQLDGAFKNRQALCKSHGWETKMIDVETSQMSGLGIWKPQHYEK